MKFILKIIYIALAISYPFGVYFGIEHFEPRILSFLLIGIVFFYFLSSPKASPLNNWQKYAVITIISSLILLLQISNNVLFIKLYPVLMSLFFLSVFSYTLINPPSMIERFARIKQPELPLEAILYTRKVTIIWCCFLLINTMIALYTAFYTSVHVWTLYNGFISYCLMGALFVGEYIVRYFIIKEHKL